MRSLIAEAPGRTWSLSLELVAAALASPITAPTNPAKTFVVVVARPFQHRVGALGCRHHVLAAAYFFRDPPDAGLVGGFGRP